MGIVLQAAHLHGHHTNSQPPNSVIPPGRPPPTKENNRKEDGHRIQPLPASRARSRILRAFEPAANEEGGVEGGGGEVVTRADGGGGHGGDKEGAGARDEGRFEGTRKDWMSPLLISLWLPLIL